MIYKLKLFVLVFYFFIESNLIAGEYWSKLDPKYLSNANGGTKIVAIKSLANGLFVCAENVVGSPLFANKTVPKITELFESIVNKDDGSISFRSIANRKLVTTQFYGPPTLISKSDFNTVHERFTYTSNSDDTMSFKAKWLAKTIGIDNNAILLADRNSIGLSESFFVFNIPVDYIIQLKEEDTLAQCVAQGNRKFITLKSIGNGKYISAQQEAALYLFPKKDVVDNTEIYELFDNVEDGTVSLRSYVNNKFVSAGVGGVLALLASSEVNNAPERFFLVNNTDETVSFVAKANGKYLSAGVSNIPTNVIANQVKIDRWERFTITTLNDMDNVPFNDRACERNDCIKKCCQIPYMKIALKSKLTKRFVGLDNCILPLWALRCFDRPGYFETFKLFGNADDNTISLKFMANNKFVSTFKDGKDGPLQPVSAVNGPAERFVLTTNPDKTVSLKSQKTGKYVAVRPAGFSLAYVLVANSDIIGPDESFDFVCME